MSKFIEIAMKCSKDDTDYMAIFKKEGSQYCYFDNKVVKTPREQPTAKPASNANQPERQALAPIRSPKKPKRQRPIPASTPVDIATEDLVWTGFSCVCDHSSSPSVNFNFGECSSCKNLVCSARSYMAQNGMVIFVCTESCGRVAEVGGSIESFSPSTSVDNSSPSNSNVKLPSSQLKLSKR